MLLVERQNEHQEEHLTWKKFALAISKKVLLRRNWLTWNHAPKKCAGKTETECGRYGICMCVYVWLKLNFNGTGFCYHSILMLKMKPHLRRIIGRRKVSWHIGPLAADFWSIQHYSCCSHGSLKFPELFVSFSMPGNSLKRFKVLESTWILFGKSLEVLKFGFCGNVDGML